jgi:DNA-binding transcriptional LysR family regulator
MAFVMPSSGRALPWVFADGQSFTPDARHRVSDDVLGLVTLARAGLGLAQVFDFLVEEDVARGTLVEVLAAHRGVSRPFALLYPKAVKPVAAVRAMIDFIVSQAKRRAAAP